jgi:two-component system, NtrC family, C4-dicarboxylate transport sensor histidine kinase DctB
MRNLAVLVAFAVATMAGLFWAGHEHGYRTTLDALADRARAALMLATDRLEGQLDRYRTLPATLAENAQVRAIPGGDAEAGNRLLERLAGITGALDIYVIGLDGQTIAASNWALPRSFVGRNYAWRPYFADALDKGFGAYHAVGTASGQRGYYFSVPIRRDGEAVGVITIKIDIAVLEARWRGDPAVLFFTDRNGVIFLANRPELVLRRLAGAPLPGDPWQYDGRILPEIAASSTWDRGLPVWLWTGPEARALPARSVWTSADMPDVAMTAHALVGTAEASAQALLTGALSAAGGGLFWLMAAILIQRRRALAQQLAAEAGANARLEAQVATRTGELSRANLQLQSEIAERSAAEAKLRAVQAELVQAGKLKALGELSAGISHELNQPLTAIRSLAENAGAFLDRGAPDKAGENLGRIAQLAERMGRIIRNLRAFARKEGEPAADVDLSAVIADALALVEGRLAAQRATLDWTPPPAPVIVRGGRVRLQQVIVNLVTNALDAMEDQADPRIVLSLQAEGDLVRLRVRDTGPGLAAPGQVFDPFYTTKPVGKGLGLGLSISYGIVQSFGGRIAGANHPEGGAEFTVELARGSGAAQAA